MSDSTFTSPIPSVPATAGIVREKLTRNEFISALQEGRTNFTNVDLSGQNLTGINFGSKIPNFTDAILRSANLTRANFSFAYLTDADLTGATLTCANLKGAILKGAILISADLTCADLTGATLTGATLTGATLTEEDFKKLKSNTTINEEQKRNIQIVTRENKNDNTAVKQSCCITM